MSKHPAADLHLPSTDQVTGGLDKTKEALEEEAQKHPRFSSERKFAKDAAELVETTKEFIQEKNQGELLQNIVLEASLAGDELADIFKNQKFFADRGQLITMKLQANDYARLAKERLESMKSLALTLINSGDFRSLLSELSDLIKETFQNEKESAPSMKMEEGVSFTEQAKDKAFETAQFGSQLVSQIKEGNLPIPEDKKQVLNYRFKQLFHKISSDQNFKAAVDGLLSLLDQISYWGNQLQEQAKQAAQEGKELAKSKDSHLSKMFCDMKSFIAGFTGEENLDTLYNDVTTFMQSVQSDSSLSSWFWDMRQYVIDVLSNPQLLENQEYTNQWNSLLERGKLKLQDTKFNNQWNAIWKDLLVILDNVKNDTLQQKLTDDASKLAHDLFLDTNGKPSLNIMGSGLNNIRNLIIPILKKNLENVPVGPISGSNETYDWVIENLLLNVKDILPDHIEMKMWGRADISLTDSPSKALTYLTMWIRNVELEAKDVKFWFHRKSIPKLNERGLADVSLKGKNELKITWKIDGSQDTNWIFGVGQVRCNLDNLDITIKESTHTFLMKMVTSLFSGTIKRNWEDKIEHVVVESLGTVNDKLNDAIKGIGY